MDDVKRKVLQELMGMMDERMGEKLKSKKPMGQEMAKISYEDRPDKGFGKIIFRKEEEETMVPKELAKSMPEMPEMPEMESEDDDEKRLREMYSKLS